MQVKPFIHPKTPRRLAAAFRRATNGHGEGYKIHVLAKTLGINVGYLHKLIKQGIEPPDSTEKGQAARAAMFLPRKKRKPRKAQINPTMPSLAWWRKLPKDKRNNYILHLWLTNGE